MMLAPLRTQALPEVRMPQTRSWAGPEFDSATRHVEK
jgi:hypothetical protein